MRTISYGIPILLLGILAALPFRRVPPPANDVAGVEERLAGPPKALVEVVADEPFVWTPPPSYAQPAAPPPRVPSLPSDYAHVAVPLETPPAIADRYSAADPFASQDAAARSAPLAGWKTDLPIGGFADPAPRLAIPWATPEQRQSIVIDPAASPDDDDASLAADTVADASLATVKVGFAPPQDRSLSDASTVASDEDVAAEPRKRYYIREPIR